MSLLFLTPSAAEAVERIVAQHDAPPGAGLRLSAKQAGADPSDHPAAVQMALVEAPEPSDHVVHAHVFIEPGRVWEFLADKLLDAELAGRDVIRFRIRSRLPAS